MPKAPQFLPRKQDIVRFVSAFEQTGRAARQRDGGGADVHPGTSQPIKKSGREWQPSLSSSCPLQPGTTNPQTLLSPQTELPPSSTSAPTDYQKKKKQHHGAQSNEGSIETLSRQHDDACIGTFSSQRPQFQRLVTWIELLFPKMFCSHMIVSLCGLQ